MEPRFLEFEEVLIIHETSIARFGGTKGIRDRGGVESAIAAAANAHNYSRADKFEIAAHYAFHLAQAQAFLDGNKRTGMGAALAFLAVNGIEKMPTAGDLDALYDAMIAIAEKRLTKTGLADVFRELFRA